MTKKEELDGFKLMISLMKELRETKNIKLLMIARQIQRIEINENKATLISEEGALDEIFQTIEYCETIKAFFKKFNLGFNINKQEELSVVDELKKWLGPNLVIK